MMLKQHTTVEETCGLYVTNLHSWQPTLQFKINFGSFLFTRSVQMGKPLIAHGWRSHLTVTRPGIKPPTSWLLSFIPPSLSSKPQHSCYWVWFHLLYLQKVFLHFTCDFCFTNFFGWILFDRLYLSLHDTLLFLYP